MSVIRSSGCLRSALVLLALWSCGSGQSNVLGDAGSQDVRPDESGVSDTGAADSSEFLGQDTHNDSSPTDQRVLPFEFVRNDKSDPIESQALEQFSSRYGQFLTQVGYFSYLLRSSHGVAASTGFPDYAVWWSDVDAVKNGDVVSFVHKELQDAGGHNILVPTAKILGTALAASLAYEIPEATALAASYCKGVSAMMKGMVRDAEDPIEHLMARNIIAFNHDYVTHDGKKKTIDYSNWFYDYTRWNCQRFKYANNPYWGEVWVTNVRSKDDVGYLFRSVGIMKHAVAESKSAEIRDSCSETLELLQKFAADIVENDYYIRTKDAQAQPFIYSKWPKPDGIRESQDLDNFVTFDPLFPEAECNNKQAANFIGYGKAGEHQCGDGGPNLWERVSLENNYPNIGFFRAFHLAHLFEALLAGDWELAQRLLEGNVRRMSEDMTYDWSKLAISGDRWHADMAPALVRAAAQGYPLSGDEVRLIHKYFQRSMDELKQWQYWDLWNDEVADGTYDYLPPRSKTGQSGDAEYWVSVTEVGLLLEYCWSPWKNPAGQAPVDCGALGKAM